MVRKAIEQVKRTPELLEHYKKVGVFLKSHPEIESKKLVLGFQVNVGTIPDNLVSEWLEITKFEH